MTTIIKITNKVLAALSRLTTLISRYIYKVKVEIQEQ